MTQKKQNTGRPNKESQRRGAAASPSAAGGSRGAAAAPHGEAAAPRRETAAMVLNCIAAVSSVVGVMLSMLKNGPDCLGLYTDECNLISAVISFVYLHNRRAARAAARSGAFSAPRSGSAPEAAVPRWLQILRYCSACALTLTFVLVMVSYLPVFTFPFSLFSPHLILMHWVSPVLSTVSFLCLEQNDALRFSDTGYAMIYTVVYGILAVSLAAAGLVKTDAYPFLQFHGTRLWLILACCLAILAAAWALCWLLYRGSRRKSLPTGIKSV